MLLLCPSVSLVLAGVMGKPPMGTGHGTSRGASGCFGDQGPTPTLGGSGCHQGWVQWVQRVQRMSAGTERGRGISPLTILILGSSAW